MVSDPNTVRTKSAPTRRLAITLEGVAWLAVIVSLWLVGWVKGINLILLLANLLLGLWVVNWWMARRSLRGLTARRVATPHIFAGQDAPWHADIVSHASSPLLSWELIDEGPGHSVRWPVPFFPPDRRARLRQIVRFPRRGSFACRPLRAICSYPFGFLRQEVRFPADDRVIVYPPIGTIHLARLRRWLLQAARPDERRHRTRRRLAQEVEFHGLRSFRPGDSPRWIHWRTSARRGELMVREFDQGSHYDLLMIVEAYQPTPHFAPFEAAVSLAATIAWQWTHDGGDRVILAIAGPDTEIHASREGSDSCGDILRSLANATGTDNPNLDALAARLEGNGLPAGPALWIDCRGTSATDIDRLSARLKRPLAVLNTANLPDFYSPPELAASR